MPRINKVISKPTAIKIALETYRDKISEFSELLISSDSIKISQVEDYLGNIIFKEIDDDVSGWLVFFNPATFMNWEHPCEYFFVINSCDKIKINYMRPLDESIAMESI